MKLDELNSELGSRMLLLMINHDFMGLVTKYTWIFLGGGGMRVFHFVPCLVDNWRVNNGFFYQSIIELWFTSFMKIFRKHSVQGSLSKSISSTSSHYTVLSRVIITQRWTNYMYYMTKKIGERRIEQIFTAVNKRSTSCNNYLLLLIFTGDQN